MVPGWAVLAEAVGEPAGELPGQLQHELRLPVEQGLECLTPKPQELAVPQRHDGGGARLAQEQRHLADRVAGDRLVDEPLLSVGPVRNTPNRPVSTT